jgi:beta-galactosidase
MKKSPFNKNWRFFLGDPVSRDWHAPDDSEWQVIDLPHDWSITLERKPDNPSTASGGFFTNGRGWYHQNFDAPTEWQNKKVIIQFEGVYMNAEVRINGNFLGRHPYGYTTFSFDLTPYLKIGETNSLRVLVDNQAQMNSRWYSGSGIYRPVWLLISDLIHIAENGVSITTPQISPESAVIHVETTIVNELDQSESLSITQRVIAPDGSIAGENITADRTCPTGMTLVTQEIHLSYPRLWSPDTPALYHLETIVEAKNEMVDTEETFFGIRSIQVDAENGFLLNGNPLLLKGGCVHHDNGVLGSASYPNSEERKVSLHKSSGFNAIRCAHNPPAPAFLDACDRLGMLVIDEAVDCWREGKNPYDYHVAFDDWWQRDIESMVLRDRNHPSVVIWSIGNEVLERDGRSNGAAIAKMLAEAIRKLDSTRPITSAICAVWDGLRTWEDTDSVFAALDLGGYNYQWQKYRSDHERHPQRVMAGTESFPLEAYDNWREVEELGYVIGDFVWTSMDYLGEAGIGRVTYDDGEFKFLGDYPWHQAYCGDIDLCGFKRPQSFYRDIVWETGDPLYIAVHSPIPEDKTATVTRWGWPNVDANWNWHGREGQTFTVDVYSPFDSVELLLNGVSLGNQPSGDAKKLIATFDVVYQPGELKAVGYMQGNPVASLSLHTTGSPAKLRLVPDKPAIHTNENELIYVTVEVIDRDGVRVPNAEHPIFFTVLGEGTLKAVGSGNPTSEEPYIGNQRKAHGGRCLVVVKSNGLPGEIHLRAQADGLEGADLTIFAR